MLEGKKILLAVCGSIAAYKIAFFVRLLIKEGAMVKVIMTKSAIDFITPLTLSTLSKHPVYSDFFEKESGVWTSHVELGLWADVMMIAPASANTIAKLAIGQCDNLLTATYLSARCPVFVSPAMDLDMLQHPTTRSNLSTLKANGNHVIDARRGELASGLEGEGRMAEPEELLKYLKVHFKKKDDLRGKKILITSGPTLEAIDPVRYIGNHSSGKMGMAIATSCANRGAEVTFVTGPVSNFPSHANIEIVKVKSACEMLEACESIFHQTDLTFFAAAVADFRVKKSSPEKYKRNGQLLQLELMENPDIAAELGKRKSKKQLHIGFALETSSEEQHALQKLKKKNFDFIVLNSLNDNGAGFSHDTNKVTIFDRDNNKYPYELKDKRHVAEDLVDLVVKRLND